MRPWIHGLNCTPPYLWSVQQPLVVSSTTLPYLILTFDPPPRHITPLLARSRIVDSDAPCAAALGRVNLFRKPLQVTCGALRNTNGAFPRRLRHLGFLWVELLANFKAIHSRHVCLSVCLLWRSNFVRGKKFRALKFGCREFEHWAVRAPPRCGFSGFHREGAVQFIGVGVWAGAATWGDDTPRCARRGHASLRSSCSLRIFEPQVITGANMQRVSVCGAIGVGHPVTIYGVMACGKLVSRRIVLQRRWFP